MRREQKNTKFRKVFKVQKRNKQTNCLGKFEKFISPEPYGISTRSNRLFFRLGNIYPYTKFQKYAATKAAKILMRKMTLRRFGRRVQ